MVASYVACAGAMSASSAGRSGLHSGTESVIYDFDYSDGLSDGDSVMSSTSRISAVQSLECVVDISIVVVESCVYRKGRIAN